MAGSTARICSSASRLPEGRVNYAQVVAFKRRLLEKACRRFREHMPDTGYECFCRENACWIDDYALFSALSARHVHIAWDRWPSQARGRSSVEMKRLRKELHDPIEKLKIEQYLFYRQWIALRSYCREKCIHLFGDLPIYVPFHSADVWAHRTLFKLDRFHRPLAVSGVPPDYFSADGQLWGHPVYNWESHRLTRFDWWVRRIAHQIAVFDAVRIDHFRGLVAYWEVAAGERTAKHGRWVEVPSADFFAELQRRFVSLPLVAEDLGHITADVRETMQRYGLPGMRVLMFGFSGDPALNPNAVHAIPEHCVVYTGTHDNNTARGWFEKEASGAEKRRLSLHFRPAGRGAGGRLGVDSPRHAVIGPMVHHPRPGPARVGRGRTHQHAGTSPRQLGLAHDLEAVRYPADRTPVGTDLHFRPRLIFRRHFAETEDLGVEAASASLLSQLSTWVNTRKRS